MLYENSTEKEGCFDFEYFSLDKTNLDFYLLYSILCVFLKSFLT